MMPQDEKVTPKNAAQDNSPAGEEGAVPNYRGLKILVIALGVAIAGMLALIVYTISQRMAEGLIEGEVVEAEQGTEVVGVVEDYLNFSIERPKGAELVAVTASGRDLVFHFRSDLGDTVITLDRRTGAQSRVDVP
ncbi:MAG: hypothetical protein HWE08_11375 [Alphaproteobacteria bacterium]|nr:hypothetical protein [Alphaproteobacteria bacterium]